MTNRIPDTASWHARLDYTADQDWHIAKAEYMARFPYCIHLKFGPAYQQEFKDFNLWCEQRLGNKFKDWFLLSTGKGRYTLYSKDNKWATFLILSHVDNIDS